MSPHKPDDPNPGLMTRGSRMDNEMSSPGISAPLSSSLGGPGKPNDGEEGIGFGGESVPKLDAYIRLIRPNPP
jgi:hypothetical protein